MRQWRAAGTIVLSTLALAGCNADPRTGIESSVADYEQTEGRGRDVDVKSCVRIGEALDFPEAPVDYSMSLVDVWKCAVKSTNASKFHDACYRVSNNAAYDRIRCASVGACPAGGRREAQTVFLGEMTDVDLAYEEDIGNSPAHETLRAEVFSKAAEGAKEHCGYVKIRVPSGGNPRARADEVIELREWPDRYSFTYASSDDQSLVVQRWLGHHKPSFTLDTYVHLLDEDVPEPTFFDAITAPCDTDVTQTGRNERDWGEAAEGGKA